MDYIAWLNDYCPQKVVTAEEAISRIKSGSRVFIGTGCGVPQDLIRSLVEDKDKQGILI